MSFPPSLPNNPLFPAGYPQPNVPPIPHRFPIPLGGLSVPIPVPPLSMGVTVPPGVATISAPPVRNQNAAVIAAPPVISIPAPPAAMLYPPQTNPLIAKPPVDRERDRDKKVNITTVFVGNITDRASDMLIRQLLSKCGTVHNWKRIQGPDGKLQAFGFCDYADPESAMRAIRLLHDFAISDKKLIVRVDAKTQEKLDEFCKNKNSEGKEKDDMIEEDKIITGQLLIVLKEHEIELSKEPEPKNNKRYNNKEKDPKNEDLEGLDMEDDKRNLIHREIDKFRDTYKKYDEEKEEEKRKKEEDKEKTSRRSDRRSPSKRSRSRDRDRRSRKSRDRDRDRDRERRSNRDRDKRSSSFEDAHLERDRDRSESPVDEEELLLRRRRQEQNREKENSYQRRLRDWEAREKRKTREYTREQQKELRRKENEEIEKQKLKQFLQDYDDNKHDEKFYSGKTLYNRQMERRKEIEQDEYEREQERKELEELRKKLNQEGHPDPESEVRKRFNIDAPVDADRLKLLMEEGGANNLFSMDDDSQGSLSNVGQSVKTFGFAGMKISAGQNLESAHIANGSTTNVPNDEPQGKESSNVSTKESQQSNLKQDSKRKKLTVSEVFGANEDDDANSLAKKRRPPPMALLEDSNTDSNLSSNSAKPNSHLSQEEKKIQIKNLIDSIPTSKSELFAYVLDWDLLDNNLMQRRIRPWIGKKIRDYIGEEEKTLLDFICNKLVKKCPAQSLLEEIAMVLDDEAQVFVVKLWRLLIYEIEAKKLGLTKY